MKKQHPTNQEDASYTGKYQVPSPFFIVYKNCQGLT